MNATHIEILYIERRIRDTLGMAKACASSCGKRVHLQLAEMYSAKLDQLRGPSTPAPASMTNTSRMASRHVLRAKTLRSATDKFTRQTGTLSLVTA
mgnify:CR=1 FL=1